MARGIKPSLTVDHARQIIRGESTVSEISSRVRLTPEDSTLLSHARNALKLTNKTGPLIPEDLQRFPKTLHGIIKSRHRTLNLGKYDKAIGDLKKLPCGSPVERARADLAAAELRLKHFGTPIPEHILKTEKNIRNFWRGIRQ